MTRDIAKQIALDIVTTWRNLVRAPASVMIKNIDAQGPVSINIDGNTVARIYPGESFLCDTAGGEVTVNGSQPGGVAGCIAWVFCD